MATSEYLRCSECGEPTEVRGEVAEGAELVILHPACGEARQAKAIQDGRDLASKAVANCGSLAYAPGTSDKYREVVYRLEAIKAAAGAAKTN